MQKYLLILLIVAFIYHFKFNRVNDKPKIVYLGGSSWGSAYYIGCYKGILKRWKSIKNIKFYGDSAGALIALTIVLNKSLSEIKQIYLNLAKEAKENGVFMKMSKYHDFLSEFREMIKD